MKNLNLILGILALINLAYTFFNASTTSTLFGQEISIWQYRLIWLILAMGCFYSYYKRKATTKK